MLPRLAIRRAPGAALALLAVAIMMSLPGLVAWAGRQPHNGADGVLDAAESQIARGLQSPPTFERPTGRSPLGDLEADWSRPAGAAPRIETPLGFVEPERLGELRGRAPLLAGARGRALGQARRGELSAGINALVIDAGALASRTADGVDRDLEALGVRIIGRLVGSGLLARVPAGAVDALAASSLIEAAMPWDPIFRVDPALRDHPR